MEFQNDTNKIPQTPSPEISKPPQKENSIKEVVKFTLIALAIVVPIRLFIAQPFIVSGASMDPTFKSGQYLIVDQLTYYFREPVREEVIIFRYPRNPKTFFIKRVIGLPGETVKLENGKITIVNKDNPDGFKLDAPYVAQNHIAADNITVTLQETEYFVMGDNRAESSDSRVWGPLERKYIVGRPALRLFPLTTIAVYPGK
jgi:signal peptidase I